MAATPMQQPIIQNQNSNQTQNTREKCHTKDNSKNPSNIIEAGVNGSWCGQINSGQRPSLNISKFNRTKCLFLHTCSFHTMSVYLFRRESLDSFYL